MTSSAASGGAAFASAAGGEPFGSMSCREVRDLTSSGAYQYVDVRTPEEYAAGHPEGAKNVPVMLRTPAGGMEPNPSFLDQFEQQFPEKGAQLCVGCASGKRSLVAASMLAQAGFTDVVNVEGGYQAWVSDNLPTST